MARFLHKLRWAFYRIGMNQNDLNAMIVHNKNQTDQQKVRRAYLGGSAPIVEGIVIQSDPSYITMCRLIKLAGLSLAPLILSHLRLSLTCAYHVSLAPRFLSHLRLVDWCGFTHVHTCNVTVAKVLRTGLLQYILYTCPHL